MESALDMTNMFRWLRLSRETEPVVLPEPLPKPLPPIPAITYDKGLPSLPDDVTYEIFGLLDMKSLKSCSLTGKVVSRSVKPIIHRTLFLTPRGRVNSWSRRDEPNTPGHWEEFKGLSILGERGLLHHTRHLSITLGRNPLFPPYLEPHIQHLQAIANLRSFKTRWLDLPSLLPKMGEYFGSFFGSLESLDLEFPRGDHQQILYFICQFVNLQNLRIKGTQDHTHSMRNGGPHFDINTFPPLDGTLELAEFFSGTDKGAMLIINNLLTAPLKFRTLKLFGCAGAHSQLLIDACAPNLESMDLRWQWAADTQCPRFSFERNPKFRKLELRLPDHGNTDSVAAWLSGTLSTVTSNEFKELTIYMSRIPPSFLNPSEDIVRRWNSIDDVLDRLSFRDLVERYFPLMWENGRIVLEIHHPEYKSFGQFMLDGC